MARTEKTPQKPTDAEEASYNYTPPEWTFHDDGSVTVHLPAGQAWNLARELTEWEALSNELRDEGLNWKRSPIARENRRESIVLMNCLRVIRAILGRAGVRQLIEKTKEGV
jgi:hypothetical protein